MVRFMTQDLSLLDLQACLTLVSSVLPASGKRFANLHMFVSGGPADAEAQELSTFCRTRQIEQ